MRKPLTTPRAELCGAVLAVRLLELVKKSLRLSFNEVFMWTDSSVVLSWIRGNPNRWTVFVCNRIHKILSSTEIAQWHHVRTHDNPADLNSRGLNVSELRDSQLWWHGPQFISLPQSNWPDSPFQLHEDDRNELRSKLKLIHLNIKEVSSVNSLIKRFSNFNRLRRAVAYALRFVQIIRSSIKLKLQRPPISMLSIPTHIATLITDYYHRLTLHGGPQVTVNQIRQTYWILDVRNFARHFIHKCVICFKARPVLSQQQMATLPTTRVNTTSRPFASTIVDYAGPYDIRASKGRGQTSYKGYVAVFTCMTTKAVHLEAAGDLTTQTFLHAFDRFISRRGFCHDVFSDCGTNFVGANNENQRLYNEVLQSIESEIIPALAT